MAHTQAQAASRRSMRAAALTGIGIMAGVDEIAFHQMLAWHHFYTRSTTEIALMRDGLLHAAGLIAIVAGFFILLDLGKSRSLVKPSLGRLCAGAGGVSATFILKTSTMKTISRLYKGSSPSHFYSPIKALTTVVHASQQSLL